MADYFVIFQNLERPNSYQLVAECTAQKMKFSIKDFFIKCGHIYWRNP